MTIFEEIKSNLHYEDLDANVVELVRAMNAIRGLVTIQSCGGHEAPRSDLAQVGTGLWYVTFAVTHFEALALLAFAAYNFAAAVRITAFYKPFSADFDTSDLFFQLNGREIAPDEFAQALAAACKFQSYETDELAGGSLPTAGGAL